MDLAGIRAVSVKELATAGIQIPSDFPLIDQPRFKGAGEAFDRLICLHAVAASSYGFPRESAKSYLEKEELWPKLEGDEARFLLNGIGNSALYQWQVQGIFVLAWAVGIVETIDLYKACPDDLVLSLPNLKTLPPTAALRKMLTLQSNTEIVAKADLAYCLHWAARDAKLNGRSAPGASKSLR